MKRLNPTYDIFVRKEHINKKKNMNAWNFVKLSKDPIVHLQIQLWSSLKFSSNQKKNESFMNLRREKMEKLKIKTSFWVDLTIKRDLTIWLLGIFLKIKPKHSKKLNEWKKPISLKQNEISLYHFQILNLTVMNSMMKPETH